MIQIHEARGKMSLQDQIETAWISDVKNKTDDQITKEIEDYVENMEEDEKRMLLGIE